MTKRAMVGLLIAASSAWLSAQPQSPEQRPTFQSSVNLTRLEVSVLDDHRRPVRGLTAADFTVLENGHERPIAAFASVDVPSPSKPSDRTAAWVHSTPLDVVRNDTPDAGRLVVIVFDWSVRVEDLALARRIALAAVDGLGPTDEAAVIFARPNVAVGTPQDFTGDHARLRAAIDRPFGTAVVDIYGKLIDPDNYESGDCLCGLCTLETLTRLGQTLRNVFQRPKVVLFIGTYVRTFEAMRPTPIPPLIPGVITPNFATMPGATDCGARLRDARRAFERSMAESNIAVNVVDPVGQETGVSNPLGTDFKNPAENRRKRLDSLPVMADMTGGRTVSDQNDPDRQVASILDESSSYYVLGFEPALSKEAIERKVQVKVGRPGVLVRSRTLYSIADAPGATGQSASPLLQAASDVLPNRDVPLELSAVPMIADRRAAVLLVGRVLPGAPHPTAIVSVALTPRAEPVVSRRLALPSAARGEGPETLVSALALKPGAYEIRLAAESPTGGVGSVHTFVTVPDFTRAPLSMSGMLVRVVPDEPGVPQNEIAGVLPFVPTTRRTFTRGQSVSIFAQVSQGTGRTETLQPVQLHLTVTDTHDAIVRRQAAVLAVAEFASNRTANVKLTLPFAGLSSGMYLLNLSAGLSQLHEDQRMTFNVQ